jgi:hypothetical protein
MRRRWFWIAGCLTVAGAAGFLCLMWLPPTDRVTQASWNEIYGEMGEADVQSVFGRPPDATGTREARHRTWKRWDGPHASLTVDFQDGVVVSKEMSGLVMENSLFERLRRLAGL